MLLAKIALRHFHNIYTGNIRILMSIDNRMDKQIVEYSHNKILDIDEK